MEEIKAMNIEKSYPDGRFKHALVLAFGVLLICGICFVPTSFGADAEVIDAKANVALKRFHSQVKGAKEFAANAKGLLIMPGVVKAAFIIGGEYVGFVFDVKGLMADISLKGAKFTKLDK
jgi:lipid-binding SYLF domain-containing protein